MKRYRRVVFAVVLWITAVAVNVAWADSSAQAAPLVASTSGPAQPARVGQLPRAERLMGTVRAGVDGDWILEPLDSVSYAQQAKDRYQCDIWAVGQTGFDPTKDEGGVPPDALPDKRAEYLHAEAACFRARGYIVR